MKIMQKIFNIFKINKSMNLYTKCPNCLSSFELKKENNLQCYTCIKCNCSYIVGTNNIISNPNPNHIHFGLNLDKNIVNKIKFDSISNIKQLLIDSDLNDNDKNLALALLKDCIDAEANFKGMGIDPAPRPFKILIEKSKNSCSYDVAKYTYLYLLNIFKINKKYIKNEFGYFGSNVLFEQTINEFNTIKNYTHKKYDYKPSSIKKININNKKLKIYNQCTDNNIPLELYEIEKDECRDVFLDSELNYYNTKEDFVVNVINKGLPYLRYGLESIALIIKAHCLSYLKEITKNIKNRIPIEGLPYYGAEVSVEITDNNVNLYSTDKKSEDYIGRQFKQQIGLYNLNKNSINYHIEKTDIQQVHDNIKLIHNNSIIKQLYPYSTASSLCEFFNNLSKKEIIEFCNYIFDNNDITWPLIIYNNKQNLLIGCFIKGNQGCLTDLEIFIAKNILPSFNIHPQVIRIKTKLTSLLK